MSNLQTYTVGAFTCLDIGTLSTTQGWIYKQHKKGYPLKIERIKLFGEEGQNYSIDNLYIGSQTPQCKYIVSRFWDLVGLSEDPENLATFHIAAKHGIPC